jgi:trimeric autotransporter adhesin
MKGKFTCLLFMLVSVSFAQTNTATGTNAGNSGSENSSFGYVAGDVITGTGNTFLGAYAGYVTTSANRNTFVGYAAGRFNTGGYNVFLGSDAGYKNTTGTNNTFLGQSSGYNITTGSNNVFIGQNSGIANTTGIGNVFIGSSAGYNELGSDKLYIDNSNTSTPLIYGDFAANKVGINKVPGAYTFDVAGTINATGLYLNGVALSNTSQWTTLGSNINYNNSGGVSIGTTTLPAGYKLAIAGKAIVEEVVVQLQANWPDYVFKTDYNLPSLSEVQKFISVNHHLPGVPSAEEVKSDGVVVGEMNAILLKKIEELTLYIIKQEERIAALEKAQK